MTNLIEKYNAIKQQRAEVAKREDVLKAEMVAEMSPIQRGNVVPCANYPGKKMQVTKVTLNTVDPHAGGIIHFSAVGWVLTADGTPGARQGSLSFIVDANGVARSFNGTDVIEVL